MHTIVGSARAVPVTESEGRAAARRWRRWFIPDLALVACFVSVLYCLFPFDGGQKLFRDSDSGWHIRTGESILATGTLPRTDPYSFTKPGETWVAWEWASDLLMGAVHRQAGLPGVATLYMLAIGFTVWLWFRLHWALGGDFLIACVMASPMLSTTNLHWLARPHVFSWIFLLVFIWQMERMGEEARSKKQEARRTFWLLASFFGTALWANMHASFIFGPLIALVYGVSHWLRPLIWDCEPTAERSQAREYFLAALAAALGSLCTPYGWNLHVHVVRYLANGELLSRVGEFQSFNFLVSGAAQIVIAMGLAALGGILALTQRKLQHFLLAAILVAMALRSARALPLVALLVLPLANGAITAALGKAIGLAPRFKSRLKAFLEYSGRLRLLDSGLHGLALIPPAVLLLFLWMEIPAVAARTGFPPSQFPVRASTVLEKLPEDIRLLAPDKFGGYLIYRFAGKRKVYFDGRSDFYGSEFMKQYGRLMQLRPGWSDQIRQMGFTHALVPSDYPVCDGLERLGWKRLYRDDIATLLAAPQSSATN